MAASTLIGRPGGHGLCFASGRDRKKHGIETPRWTQLKLGTMEKPMRKLRRSVAIDHVTHQVPRHGHTSNWECVSLLNVGDK